MNAGYRKDPDFDRCYPLSAILSLATTPPPRPLAALRTPTLFIVARRGFIPPAYFRDLYDRLPLIDKQWTEVDGSVYWMLSHPGAAATLICRWFDRSLPADAALAATMVSNADSIPEGSGASSPSSPTARDRPPVLAAAQGTRLPQSSKSRRG